MAWTLLMIRLSRRKRLASKTSISQLFLASKHMINEHLSRHIEIGDVAMANTVQSSIIVCQICKKREHSAISCFNRHNEQLFPTKVDRSRQPRNNYNFRNNYKNNNKSPAPSANAVWYPASGASDHVTNDLQCIQDNHYSSKSLTVANGSLIGQ
ncbi:hypothetical protein ZOSMA_108G00310 [Zostera marina]|uniref:Uncharacterized protein n=1 Tax=Zostera marina TaxID=29655 RepID=A0A0K9Q3X4_ZOSMR|nr:hypothetical protein ZOSMA_108G00310 [Zostera marina]